MQALKSQDVLVTLKLLSLGEGESLTYQALAESMKMSVSEVHASVRRGHICGLLVRERSGGGVLRDWRPLLPAVEEFLSHGLRYVFPARLGSEVVGIPAAMDAPVLAGAFQSTAALPYVWASSRGTVRGIALTPLYRSVPEAVLESETFYQWVALADALRLGRGRVTSVAREILSDRIRRIQRLHVHAA